MQMLLVPITMLLKVSIHTTHYPLVATETTNLPEKRKPNHT
jgi:hypothetical protein